MTGELIGNKMWHFASPATPVIENGLLDLVCDRKPKQKRRMKNWPDLFPDGKFRQTTCSSNLEPCVDPVPADIGFPFVDLSTH